MGPGTAGTRSGLTTLRAAAVRAVSGFTPNAEENTCAPRRLTRAKGSTAFQCFARRSATASAAGLFSRALNSLINAPVLMPIGQGMEHMPSPAHVSIPSYWYSCWSCASMAEPLVWRTISRRTAIRWRGVMVTLRLGQTGSQNPHSMHCEEPVTPSICGKDFRCSRWRRGLRVRITSGARIPWGSASCLMRHIIAVAFSPHSDATNGAMFRPVPCSAFREPSCFVTTRSTSSVMNAEYRDSPSAPPRSATSVKWRFPWAACPAIPGMNPCLASSSCTSCAPCVKRSGGKQTSSVMRVEPSGRFLPTRPRSPSRTCQASSMASATLVNSTGLINLAALASSTTCRCVASSESESSAPISTSRAAALGSRVLQYAGVSAKAWPATVSAGATISSTADAPRRMRPGTRAIASSIVGTGIHATLVTRGAGIVSMTASAMNASVPSEPTRRRRKIPSGVSPSSSAQSRNPCVFLMAYLRRVRSASTGSARSSRRSSSKPSASRGSASANAFSAPGLDVSMTAPDGVTNVSAETVW